MRKEKIKLNVNSSYTYLNECNRPFCISFFLSQLPFLSKSFKTWSFCILFVRFILVHFVLFNLFFIFFNFDFAFCLHLPISKQCTALKRMTFWTENTSSRDSSIYLYLFRFCARSFWSLLFYRITYSSSNCRFLLWLILLFLLLLLIFYFVCVVIHYVCSVWP